MVFWGLWVIFWIFEDLTEWFWMVFEGLGMVLKVWGGFCKVGDVLGWVLKVWGWFGEVFRIMPSGTLGAF